LEPLAEVVPILAAVQERRLERLGLGPMIQDLLNARGIMALTIREDK
jgi:hypothetical protein